MLIHDLKGPISEVMANLNILFPILQFPTTWTYVEAAQSGCDNLYRMISDLLDIASLAESFNQRDSSFFKKKNQLM